MYFKYLQNVTNIITLQHYNNWFPVAEMKNISAFSYTELFPGTFPLVFALRRIRCCRSYIHIAEYVQIKSMSTHPNILMHNIISLFTVFDCCDLVSVWFFSVDSVLFPTGRKVLVSIAWEVLVTTCEIGCAAVVSFSR